MCVFRNGEPCAAPYLTEFMAVGVVLILVWVQVRGKDP